MIDLDNEHDVVALLPFKPGAKLLLAASDGRGFLVASDEVVAQTRNGKQVLNLGEGDKDGGAKAVFVRVGRRRHGRGDRRQSQALALPSERAARDGQAQPRRAHAALSRWRPRSDATVIIVLAEGLSWTSGERTRTETDLGNLEGRPRQRRPRDRAAGIPEENKFG